MERTRNKHNISIWAVWITVLSVIAILAIAGAVYKTVEAKHYETAVESQYARAFHQINDDVRDIEIALEKGMLVTNPRQAVTLANEINAKAESAKACLGQLPLSDVQLENTSRFLSQVGDYTYSLSLKAFNEEPVTEEEYQVLKQLKDYSQELSVSLGSMQDQLYQGTMTLSRINNVVSAGDNDMPTAMGELEKEFVDYPALVYDGPFSSHVQSRTPALTQNQPEVSAEEAKTKVKEFLGDRAGVVEISSEKAGNMPTYSFVAYPDPTDRSRSIYVDVTKAGRYIAWMLDNRPVTEQKLSMEDAKKMGAAFLSVKGYHNLRDSYYEVLDNVATINYATEQNGYVVYPDLIKVKVALDTGEVLGVETTGYIMNHKTRTMQQPKITEEEARSKVSPALQVESVSLAVIPTDSGGEIECYEVRGKADERNCLVYINTQTGLEEKILLLLESESGVLSM